MNTPEPFKDMLAVPAKDRDNLIFQFAVLGREYHSEIRKRARRHALPEADSTLRPARPVVYRMKVQP